MNESVGLGVLRLVSYTSLDTMSETTTLQVSTDMRNALFHRKKPTESYDDVIRRILEENKQYP